MTTRSSSTRQKLRPCRLISARSRAALLGLLMGAPLSATTFYWDNGVNNGTSTSGASGNALNWATTLAGGTDPVSAPTGSLADDWYFSASTILVPQTMGLNGSRSTLGLTFSNAVSTSIENHTTNGATNTLTIGSGGVTVNSGPGTVLLGSNSGTRGFMSYRLAANQSWTNNSSSTLSVTGNISNVSNASPYTLTLAGSGSAGFSIPNTISDGGTTGTLSLTLNHTGGGTANLSGANTYTGETRLQAGTLNSNNALGLQGSTVNLATGDIGTLTFGTSITTSSFGGLKGSRTLTLTNTNATPAAVALTVGGNQADSTFSGVLSGLGSLNKTGAGTLTLSGASDYAGATTVSGGTLLLDKSTGTGALPAGSNLTLTGGRFQVKGAASGATSQTLGNLAALNIGITNKIVLDSNGGSGTTLTLGGAAPTRVNSATLLVDLSSPNTVLASSLGLADGAQAGNAAILGYALVKDGTGTGFATNVGGNLVRYTGATELTNTSSDATVNFKITPNGVSTTGAPLLTTATGAALNSLSIDTSGATGANVLALSGTVTLAQRAVLMTGDKNFTIQGGASLGASGHETVIHNAGTGTLTINSPINTDAVPVAKDGSGTVVLGGSSNFSNTLRVNEGVLKLGATGGATNTPLGTAAAGTVVYRGGALDLGGFTLGTAEALVLNGTGVSGGGALLNSGGAATYSGAITLGSASSIVATGDITLSHTGVIGGSGFGLTLDGTSTASTIGNNINTSTGGVTKTGAGTWTLAGSSTYTGATTLNQGTLVLGVSNVASFVVASTFATGQKVVTVGSTANMAVGQGVSGTGITTGTTIASIDSDTQLTLSANTTAAGSSQNLTYAAYSPLGVGGNVLFSGGRLKYGTGVTTDYSSRLKNSSGTIAIDTNGNSVSFAAVIDTTNAGGLAKYGLGKLSLNGASTFTGTTTVYEGSLGGAGSLAGGLTAESGAAISPGTTAVGTFTVGGELTLKGGSVLSVDLAAPGTGDLLAVTGAVSSTGTTTVNITDAGGLAAGSYTLISGSAPIAPAFFTVGTIPSGLSGSFSSVDNTLVLTIADASALSALETWRQARLGSSANSGDSADGADPDKDGLSNLIEYATNTDPLVSNSSAVAVGSSGGFLTLTYTRIADATLTYTVEGSNDLATWATVSTGNNPSTGVANVAGQVTVTDTTALTSRRFLRLKVSY